MRATFAFCVAVSTVALSYGQESLFPSVSGWTMRREATRYDSNNLWDIIDGAADLYLQYGFVDLHIARYSRSDGLELKVELYRHSSGTNTFGIYSQERDTVYNFMNIGVQGYLQKGVLNFFAGVYYIKLSTHQVGKTAQEALLTIGRKVEEHLKQDKSWPETLTMFPPGGKLSNTEQFVAKNFLGFSFLSSAFVASYRDPVPFRMFIIDANTAERASAMCEEYVRAIPKDAIRKVVAGRYEIRDPRNGFVEIVVIKQFLCGVIDCQDKRIREKHLRKLTATLSNRDQDKAVDK